MGVNSQVGLTQSIMLPHVVPTVSQLHSRYSISTPLLPASFYRQRHLHTLRDPGALQGTGSENPKHERKVRRKGRKQRNQEGRDQLNPNLVQNKTHSTKDINARRGDNMEQEEASSHLSLRLGKAREQGCPGVRDNLS